MHIKDIMRYPFLPIRMPKTKTNKQTNNTDCIIGKDLEEL